jgi:hypothetical protein
MKLSIQSLDDGTSYYSITHKFCVYMNNNICTHDIETCTYI